MFSKCEFRTGIFKPSSFLPGDESHFRSLSRLSLFWMPTAMQPVLCREPLDCRQHAVEMSAKGNRRKGRGWNLFSFHLFNHKFLLYCTSTVFFISSFLKNDGTSQTMRIFLLYSIESFILVTHCIYMGRYVEFYKVRLEHTIILFLLFKVISFIWNRCDALPVCYVILYSSSI